MSHSPKIKIRLEIDNSAKKRDYITKNCRSFSLRGSLRQKKHQKIDENHNLKNFENANMTIIHDQIDP